MSFGITRVADLTGLDDVGIPVFQAVRPAAETLSVSQGKGLSSGLARVSAAMEAIELWHAERLSRGTRRGSRRAMGALPYTLGELNLMPRSLVSDDVVLGWHDGVGILTGAPIPVPHECVAVSALLKPDWDFPTFVVSSTGLASGNTLTEATLHGLYEVIERDCTATFQELRDRAPLRLDLRSVDDPPCRVLLDRFDAAGNDVAVFQITGPISVPCFEAQITSRFMRGIWSGAGCHLDEGVALSRALTEAAQSRLTSIAGARDDIQEDVYTRQHELSADGDRLPPALQTTPFRRRAPHPTQSLLDDLAIVTERVQRYTGREPLFVDLTRSPCRVPVVKVVAPRLRRPTRL